MEDIKTNFEKIMEQFSENISPHEYGFPKKLSFDHLGDSFQSNSEYILVWSFQWPKHHLFGYEKSSALLESN